MKRYSKRFLAFLLAFTLILSMAPSIAAVNAEPKSSDSGDYYLFGYINGANYGCESDWQNLGAYGFTNGKLTATFTEDSYIGVKSGDNANWYMTDGWLGTEVSTATLYNADTYSFANEKNKLYVPGGVELTFTLVVDPSTDSMVLSYTTGGQTTDPDPDPEPTLSDYYLTGGMNGWNTQDSAYRLSTGTNSGEYVLQNVALEEGTEVKIVNPTSNSWYPDGANYSVPENGIFDLSFYPAGGMTGYYQGYFKLTKVGEYTPEPTEVEYYLTGTFANWGMNAAYKLSPGENDGEYVLSGVTLSAGAGVKVVSSKNNWYPSGTGNDYSVPSAGTYDVSFYPAGGVADYYEGFFKLTKTGGSVTPVDHTGADDKVILHCWNWSYDVIRENLPAIKAAGFTSVQTSPAQVPKGYHAEGRDNEVSGNWWALYQPVSFCIAPTNADSYLGGKAELQALCEAAHELGIEVVVDIVSNHVGNGWNDIHNAGGDPEQPVGDGGKLFWITPSGEVASYGLNWLLEKDGDSYKYFRDYIKCTDNSTQGTVQGCIELPDLKTETPEVQAMVAGYLEELIDVGVDGFRFDAAKHIETPTDGDYASDYWPNILNAAEAHFKDVRGEDAELWSYGEILYQAAYTRNMSQYTPYLDVTDINYAGGLIYGFGEGQGASSIANLEIRDWNGANQEPIPSESVVLFAETHDMYSDANYSTSKFSVQDVNKSWAVAAARADVSALYFARPAGYSDNAPQGTMGQMESTDWMDVEVAEANKFHTAFIGADEYVHAEGDLVLIERWNEEDCGLVMVNAVGTTATAYAPVSYVEDGTYYDQITGEAFTVANGYVSGPVGSTGIVVLRSQPPVVCEHPEDQRYTKTVEATCTENGYEAIYCGECGRMLELVRTIPALGHVDADGDQHCDRCGEFLGVITVYFVDSNDWIPANNYYDCVRVHAWNETGGNNGWPGTDMEIVGRTKDDHGIWKIDMNPEKYTMLLFDAGENGVNQTVDLPYVEDAGTASYVVYTPDYLPVSEGRTFDGTESLYVNTAAVEWWANDGAILHMTLTKDDGTQVDLTLTQEELAIFGAVIPAGTYVTLNLSRYNPNYDPTLPESDENKQVWNRTGEIGIPGKGNYIKSFIDGSAAAEWGFWPETETEKLNATPGAVLKDICGHTAYEVVTENGVEKWICDCCGEIINGDEHIHTPADPVIENNVDPTCTEAGHYDSVVYCSVCGEELSRETVTVPATGHAYGAPEWTWNADNTAATAKFTCANCGDVQTLDAVITETVLTEAKPHVAGEKKLTATVTFNETAYTDEKTVAIEALPCPCADFEDMPEYGTPEHEAIDWAFVNGITAGLSATEFGTNKTLNRAQAATFLYAAAGKPDVDTTATVTFNDVVPSNWYYTPVLWAASNNLVAGYENNTFRPNNTLTRAQILTILYAWAGRPDVSDKENKYSDVVAKNWYYAPAVWAYYAGIERGENGKFAQGTLCTRATFVLYLYRHTTGNCLLED